MESTGLSSLTTKTNASVAKGCFSHAKPSSSFLASTSSFASPMIRRSALPSSKLKYAVVVLLKCTRSSTSSGASPSSSAQAASASGAVEVEPSRRGMFSRVKVNSCSASCGCSFDSPHAVRTEASSKTDRKNAKNRFISNPPCLVLVSLDGRNDEEVPNSPCFSLKQCKRAVFYGLRLFRVFF